MNYAEQFSAVAGVFVPMLVAFITNTQTSSKVKGWLAAGLSVVVGGIMAYLSGDIQSLSGEPMQVIAQVVQYVAIVGVSAQTAYNMWIKPSGFAEKVQRDFGNKTPEEDVEIYPVEG